MHNQDSNFIDVKNFNWRFISLNFRTYLLYFFYFPFEMFFVSFNCILILFTCLYIYYLYLVHSQIFIFYESYLKIQTRSSSPVLFLLFPRNLRPGSVSESGHQIFFFIFLVLIICYIYNNQSVFEESSYANDTKKSINL